MPVILIADDHPLYIEALSGLIGRLFPGAVIRAAEQVNALYDLAQAHPHADLLLLDLDMPGATGFDTLTHVLRLRPRLPVAIVSAHDDPQLMRRAIDHGATGFIPKSANAGTIGQALRHVLRGGIWLPFDDGPASFSGPEGRQLAANLRELTPQQYRVLRMVGAGLLNKQIAHELNVAEATVKTHMTAVMRKLCVTNRTQAVLIAGRLGLSAWR
ncbi:response regulator transcription factor [Achromobacter sp. UMC46]|uniref:response regulator transcription factor n=1 Tax=Achromobacter sp. UMC46 TaxID=1862319 RepID=UPI001602B80A|nr:response regulator transcription factor [Achromobacter sp. UMC46]MBB1596826.1 DNA-binding response regulator [Achromobacter sp. UMC46]